MNISVIKDVFYFSYAAYRLLYANGFLCVCATHTQKHNNRQGEEAATRRVSLQRSEKSSLPATYRHIRRQTPGEHREGCEEPVGPPLSGSLSPLAV